MKDVTTSILLSIFSLLFFAADSFAATDSSEFDAELEITEEEVLTIDPPLIIDGKCGTVGKMTSAITGCRTGSDPADWQLVVYMNYACGNEPICKTQSKFVRLQNPGDQKVFKDRNNFVFKAKLATDGSFVLCAALKGDPWQCAKF